MRDEFSKDIKRKLASRVAWRCCFSGCNIVTIGPDSETNEGVINLGEAAHITAASVGGPRYVPILTGAERSSIDNGIWMCRTHARLIDADYTNYSAETLRQWKKTAENHTYKALKSLETLDEDPSTLMCLGHNLLFTTYWKSIDKNGIWTFEVKDFIYGNKNLLLDFVSKWQSGVGDEKYVIIESQGDGRVLGEQLNVLRSDSNLLLSFSVKEKNRPEDPNLVGGDIALGEDGDISFENGDFKTVQGIECAKQLISNTLSINYGELSYAPLFGSFFSRYFWDYKEDLSFLERLLKLEVIRLISIPIASDKSDATPALNFVNRITGAKILDANVVSNRIPIELSGEWGNGIYFKEKFKIYVHPKHTINS